MGASLLPRHAASTSRTADSRVGTATMTRQPTGSGQSQAPSTPDPAAHWPAYPTLGVSPKYRYLGLGNSATSPATTQRTLRSNKTPTCPESWPGLPTGAPRRRPKSLLSSQSRPLRLVRRQGVIDLSFGAFRCRAGPAPARLLDPYPRSSAPERFRHPRRRPRPTPFPGRSPDFPQAERQARRWYLGY